MNNDMMLKIQACLDNELGASEAREVSQLLERNAEARALHAELTAIRDLTIANEPEHTLPESKEFYWSKIEREISHVSARPMRRSWGLPYWGTFWTRLAALCLVVLGVGLWFNSNRLGLSGSQAREVESALDDMNMITFHSESANMTVVWVQSSDSN